MKILAMFFFFALTGGASAFASNIKFTGDFKGADLEIPDPLFDVSNLPIVSVYFSDDNGTTWYQDLTKCAKVYGSYDSIQTFTITPGKLTLHRNYCISGATHYQVVVRN